MRTDVAEEARLGVSTMRVGWIGAGKMGAPMVRNLLAAGVEVAVTDPEDRVRADLVKLGATDAPALAGQRGSEVVFATVPNDTVLREVVLGNGSDPGLTGLMARGSVLVDMSTVSPECSAEISDALEKSGIYYLRAPLSGSTSMAQSATLTVLASGDQAAWDRALPLMKLLSARQFHLGAG